MAGALCLITTCSQQLPELAAEEITAEWIKTLMQLSAPRFSWGCSFRAVVYMAIQVPGKVQSTQSKKERKRGSPQTILVTQRMHALRQRERCWHGTPREVRQGQGQARPLPQGHPAGAGGLDSSRQVLQGPGPTLLRPFISGVSQSVIHH